MKQLDQWCSAIPGLIKICDGFWRMDQPSAISFPEDGHTLLAAIEPLSYWFNHRNDVIAAGIKNFPPSDVVFDVGGGNGYVSVVLKHAGFECVVIEPGSLGAANAFKRGIPTICAAFQNLDLPPASVSAMGMFDVLEHISDDTSALKKAYRAMTPGGRIYITVPAHAVLWSDEDDKAGHFRRYDLTALRRRLSGAGFLVEYETYFFQSLVLPIFFFRRVLGKFTPKRLDQNAQIARQHSLPRGVFGKMLKHSFERELRVVSQRRKIGWGSSCFIIARKD